MAQPDDGRGNIYEQVLEYAKREMDEAASKMEEIKQSLQLLEARVEAAKAVYQAVASRLNVEDEAEGSVFETSYPDAPVQVPEPPPEAVEAPVASDEKASASVQDAPASTNGSPLPSSPVEGESLSDLDLIRQHLDARAERETETVVESRAVNPIRESAPAPSEPSSETDDSFSMQLIRQHLEQKAKMGEVAPEAPKTPESVVPESLAQPEVAPAQSEGAPILTDGGASGLSEVDRELIGAYLKSKQN